MKYFILIITLSLYTSCNSAKKSSKNSSTMQVPSASVMIYKTKKDYFKNVPITLSEDKSKIVAYPHPKDLKIDGLYRVPTKLKNGFLLDNKGININTAFLKLTYEEYAKLENAPLLSKLKTLIIDDNPFTELYYCGLKSNFKDLKKELNNTIKKNKLNEYKKLK